MVCLRGCECCKGACCVDDGVGGYTCSVETCYDCDSNGGFWQGPGTTCNSSVICPCDRPADHRYCEKCENGTRGSRCVAAEYCDDGDCTEYSCVSCKKDCIAENDGNAATYVCGLTPLGGQWEWFDGPIKYEVSLHPYRTEGYGEAIGCGPLYLHSRVLSPDAERTFEWDAGTLVYDENGCLESIELNEFYGESDATSACGDPWFGCIGTGCKDLTPPTPVITFNCTNIACVIDDDCPEGYCCGAICTPGNCNQLP